MTQGERAGEVTHFFNNISVAALDLVREIELGDSLHFLGSHTDFRQTVESMQIEHEDVETASPGQEVAIKVKQRVRPGDSVYLLQED